MCIMMINHLVLSVLFLIFLLDVSAQTRCVLTKSASVGSNIAVCAKFEKEKQSSKHALEKSRGGWELDDKKCYFLDVSFANSVIKGVQSDTVADIGAGLGCYTNYFRHNSVTVLSSFDFAHNITKRSRGVVHHFDASLPYPFAITPDWTFSVEVGEHIPLDGFDGFLRNIAQGRCGAILTWAARGQGGTGHVNCKNWDELEPPLAKVGLVVNKAFTDTLSADLTTIRRNVRVLTKDPFPPDCAHWA
jgi:hypothetical protein